MDVDNPDRSRVRDDKQVGDGARIRHLQCLGGQRLWLDGLQVSGHHLGSVALQQVRPHVPPQDAVGDDTGEPLRPIGDADGAER